jgi:hypothetical protein
MDIDTKKQPSAPDKKKGALPSREAVEQENEQVRHGREESTFQSPEPGMTEEQYIDEGAAQTK